MKLEKQQFERLHSATDDESLPVRDQSKLLMVPPAKFMICQGGPPLRRCPRISPPPALLCAYVSDSYRTDAHGHVRQCDRVRERVG